MKKVICIMGPTGAGKTGTAIKLAKAGHEIHVINTDSRQVYKDFPLVSAQPDIEEKSVCPHMLYGYLPSTERISAGKWTKLAKEQIDIAHKKNSIPVLVGGTGLYFRALFDGFIEIPEIPNSIHQKYIDMLEEIGSQKLYKLLEELDPVYAKKIHYNDKQRVARALEVFDFTGKKFSDWHKEHQEIKEENDYDVLRLGIGINLTELTPLLQKRTQVMLERGALLEVKNALVECPDLAAPAWTGIGCREIAFYLQEKYSLEECLQKWNQSTRDYAKRQWTWFNTDKRITWFTPFENSLSFMENFLKK